MYEGLYLFCRVARERSFKGFYFILRKNFFFFLNPEHNGNPPGYFKQGDDIIDFILEF